MKLISTSSVPKPLHISILYGVCHRAVGAGVERFKNTIKRGMTHETLRYACMPYNKLLQRDRTQSSDRESSTPGVTWKDRAQAAEGECLILKTENERLRSALAQNENDRLRENNLEDGDDDKSILLQYREVIPFYINKILMSKLCHSLMTRRLNSCRL